MEADEAALALWVAPCALGVMLAACNAAKSQTPAQLQSGPAIAASAAPDGASAPAPPLALAAPDAARGAVVPPPGPSVVAVDVPGFEWARYELWKEPSTSHPRGTVVGLAYQEGAAWLVEVDLATAAPLARKSMGVAPRSPIELTRSGDQLHAVAQSEQSLVWITYNLSLMERRRVELLDGRKAHQAGLSGFAVADDRAVVVLYDASALVFDERGVQLAAHNCRPLGFIGNARARIVRGNGLVVIQNLSAADANPAVCAFRADGVGATRKVQYRWSLTTVFDVEGALYGDSEDGVRKLGTDLRPVGPPVVDPRPAFFPRERCPVTGDLVIRDDWAWGTEVILTGWCCGGDPGGLFLCSRRDSTPPPRTGTRATPEREVLP